MSAANPNPDSTLELLREAIARRLENSDDFRGVSVLTRQRGDVVQQALAAAAKVGVLAEVVVHTALPRPYQSRNVLLDVQMFVEITEKVVVNGIGKGAAYLAERAVALLQLWTPPHAGLGPLTGAPPGITELPLSKESAGFYVVQAHFTCQTQPRPRTD